jgi:transcriptional regulator with XRE-family HTH domain
MEKLDSKKVQAFLKNLTSVEFRYLELSIQIVSNLQMLIKRYKLDKERFCELFHISPKRYENYIKGNTTYKLDDMATLNYVYQQLETEKIQHEDRIKIATEKDE